MDTRLTISRRHGAGWRAARLGLALLAMCAAVTARAEDCSDYPGGIIDGFAGTPAPSQIQIDTNCTIRNYPASNPLATNFSFMTQPGQTDERWIVIFDNVVHTGQMACNSVAGHKIWFTNGSSTSIQEGCQNLLIPVEKIDKQNPAGPATAAIGVPFTYRLTMPVLFDPATGTVINTAGSLNDLHGVTITDDLNAVGVDLSYVSHVAYWEDTGTPVAHTFSNNAGLLTFDAFPIIPAGRQIVVEITVVLDDTTANAPGTQFINTAKWDFGRLIDGVFYEPLPGEWGITPPMTVAGPELTLTKSGPATLNLGDSGNFTIDVQNVGNSLAWDATVQDRLPDEMCAATPVVTGAQVFAADGSTAVPGKGPLVAGVDYQLSYSGTPSCELTFTALSAAASIGPTERLIISYQAQLDFDTPNGASLTNVAGVTEWFNDDDGNASRIGFTRTITDGSVGVVDHEDAHTVVTALTGLYFEKSVANLTTGVSPTPGASPGDVLRYTLRVRTTDSALNNARILDDLGSLNSMVVFEPGSLTLLGGTIPAGADTGNTNANGGTNGAGLIDIRDLDIPLDSEINIQFDVTLTQTVIDGTVVTNQAELFDVDSAKLADSDDPYVNGIADPDVPGDEDPTRVLIEAAPPTAAVKANTQATAAIGETFAYRLTVPSVPHTAPIYDVRITDDLAGSAADLQFVSVSKISGGGTWNPVNTGTDTALVIEDPVNGIDIPAGEQIVIEITVRLLDTPTNIAGLTFTNTAGYTYNLLDGDVATTRTGEPGTTEPMTIVEPDLIMQKSGPPQMQLGVPGTFTLDVHNTGGATAYSVTVEDVLPDQPDGGMCDAAPAQLTAQLFAADGVTAVSPPLVEGTDFSASFSTAPGCLLEISILDSAAAIGPDQRLIVTYQTYLDGDSQELASLTNVAGATEWFSADVTDAALAPYARTDSRVLTDGTVNTADHEDAHTVVVFTPVLVFQKTAVNVTTGDDPGTTASPGDTIRYSLVIENASDTPIADFALLDELDRLNATASFQPGTLNVVSVPAGADASATDPNGGASGTGLLDVRGLNLAGLGDTVTVEFEVVLAPVIANGSYVFNQSEIQYLGVSIALSDDPNVNGADDPNLSGDEDPTQILIQSAPAFRIEKISSYLTGDPTVLLAGETLRYTITVQNVGTDHATGVSLSDQIPANTTYVAGSTTLNGAPLADIGSGSSPLTSGIPVNAPQDPVPGNMNAGVADNVATITFDVVVYPDVADGTIIENQAFVSAVDYGIADLPSDDPRTPVADDPTRDIVGNLPLLFAEKSAELLVDAGSPGIVDPGDVLRYTIAIYNNGSIPATGVELYDTVPANTTYVADSVTLNNLPVGQPDGGVFPLAAQLPVSSADLTPPLPGVGEGTLSPGAAAVVQFDLRVDDGVPTGTLITNQATVYSTELPNLLTDGDGDPTTGPEPTVVVVGDAQQLTITKSVAVVDGGPAIAGATLEYTVTVQNVGAVPALYVMLTDDLDEANPGYLTYVDQSARLNGLPDGITFAGTVITADYATEYGPLDPGASVTLRFRATIDPNLADGTPVTNIARVAWNDPQQWAEASVTIAVGGVVNAGILSGRVWHDADFDDTADAGERLLEGWTVTLVRNNVQLRSMLTDVDGNYVMSGVQPSYNTGDTYSLVFSAPGAGTNTATLGMTDSDFADGMQRIDEIDVQSGSNLRDLNLPIDPNGVVYNAVSRSPVAGATVTMLDASSGAAVSGACFDDAAQQGQVTLADGYYKFDLNFSDPTCIAGDGFLLQVVAPDSTYIPGPSVLIPPVSGGTTAPFDVPSCPGSTRDAILATGQHCEVQPSEFAPPSSVPAQSAGTAYHAHLTLDDSQPPGSSQLFNNHLPLDPDLGGAVSVTKTTPLLNVNRGELVPYVITVSNSYGADLLDVNIVDRFPAGFRYVDGSARFDDVPAEPSIAGREMTWTNLVLTESGQHTIKLLMVVGAGVSEGEFTNRAQAMNAVSGAAMSEEASATVRIVPDPTFDCSDVTGKVFDDDNRNGYQDGGEEGIAGVRVVTARGLAAKTDSHGRYHITCAITPHESRGSNFVLKLDDRTLPSGYRVSTRPVQVQRATRGKALRINFGASIHRVVGLDLADPVFEPGSDTMREQWRPRLQLLLEELQKGPAVLRLSYLADVEDQSLVNRRVNSLKDSIMDAWTDLECCYDLVIESEVFWRLGGPPPKSKAGNR